MKKLLLQLSFCLLVTSLTGCGESANSGSNIPDPATQPEAQAALFQRTYDRATTLIANKDYTQARETIALLKQYKLTDEQQKKVSQLEAQIPKAN